MTVPPEFLSGHVVLVGHGRVGRRIAAVLDESGVAYIPTAPARRRWSTLPGDSTRQ